MKYEKFEFCKAKKCINLQSKNWIIKCLWLPKDCVFTAKEFHEWLNKNGFEIVKKEK